MKHPNVLVVTEHWLLNYQMSSTRLKSFGLVSSYCRGEAYGGVRIFAKEDKICD